MSCLTEFRFTLIALTASYTPTAHFLLSTKQQTDTVADKMVKTLEHLAAKEPDVSVTKNGANRE